MRSLATALAACLLIAPPTVWGQLGLHSYPSPVTFDVLTGASTVSQQVVITFNGSPVTIADVSTSKTAGQNWLVAFVSGTGLLTVAANPTVLAAGVYTGAVVVATPAGQVSFQVNLRVGPVPPPGTTVSLSLILALTGFAAGFAAVGLYRLRRSMYRRSTL